jgi:hypothetical protein
MGLSAQEKIVKGVAAFSHFHNRAIMFYGYNYKSSFDAAKKALTDREPRFFEFLGNAVTGMPEPEIKMRMEAICDVNKGQLPGRLSDFLRPFSDPSKIEIGFTDKVRLFSGAVFEGVADTAQQIGQGAADTLKTTGLLLPFAIAAAVFLIIMDKTKAA